MVDFRYHLVSLVSVFLALAVGIILGAGPLQDSLGSALTGQVESLRESRDDLRAQLDDATRELDGNSKALQVAGDQLLPGTLKGRNVAIVVLPDANDDGSVEDELTEAGATISGKVALTEAFADSSQKTYRAALASQVKDYIPDLADNASNEEIIASAVDSVLRVGADDSDAKVLLGSLTTKDNAMMTVSQDITGAADAIVMIAPTTLYSESETGATASPSAEENAEAAARTDVYVSSFAAIAERGASVALGTANADTDLLSAIRARGEGSTVDSEGTVTAALNVAFAVGNELTGDHVALGNQQGAKAALGTRSEAAVSETASPTPSATAEDAK